MRTQCTKCNCVYDEVPEAYKYQTLECSQCHGEFVVVDLDPPPAPPLAQKPILRVSEPAAPRDTAAVGQATSGTLTDLLENFVLCVLPILAVLQFIISIIVGSVIKSAPICLALLPTSLIAGLSMFWMFFILRRIKIISEK